MIYVEIDPSTGVALPLPDAYNASIKTELNGQFDLTFTVPLNSTYADRLAVDLMVSSDDPVYSRFRFRIYDVRNGMATRTVSCHMRVYDLRFSVVKPFTATSLMDAVNKINANITNSFYFEFFTDISDSRAFTFAKPTSAWALIGELQKIYGFDVWYSDTRVSFQNRNPGANLDFEIRFGENLQGYDVEFDDSKYYNAVLPYWQKSGSTLTYGSITRSASAAADGYDRILLADFTKNFERQPTAAQLNAAAQNYITSAGIGIRIPASVKTTPAILKNTIMDRVELGSMVKIYGPDGGFYEQRVVAMNYDPIAERFRSIDLGTPRETIESVIQSNTASVEELDNNRFSAAPVILARSTSTSPSEISMTEGYVTENFHSFILSVRNSIRVLVTTTIQRSEIADTTTSEYSNNDATRFKDYGITAFLDGNCAAWCKINLAAWKCKLMTTSSYEAVLYGLR